MIDYGSLVISLDFELMWGILDHNNPMEYKNNIAGVWDVIPRMLKLFERYQIHATWGIVGLLLNKDIEQCKENIPEILPQYADKKLSAYFHFKEIEAIEDKYLFASDLIKKIATAKYQEIGSHTYSHYYCSENGQSKKEFQCDLAKAKDILTPYSDKITSLILPRNQLNKEYADVMYAEGFLNYRGNEKMWIYQPCELKKYKGTVRRILRLIDHYICISGHNCYEYSEIPDDQGLNNIRSSHFFRPYSKKLFFLEPIRMHRIKKQMKHAAIHHQVFHIWWHPHNFGINMEENFRNLSEILKYYKIMHIEYGMESLNMREVGERLR